MFKGAVSRFAFACLESLTLFEFVIFNVRLSFPSFLPYGLLLSLWCFSFLVNCYFKFWFGYYLGAVNHLRLLILTDDQTFPFLSGREVSILSTLFFD